MQKGDIMKKVVVDSRIKKSSADTLSTLGYELIKLPPFPALQAPVSAHPDMLIFIFEKNIVCHKDYLAIAKNELEEISALGYTLMVSDEPISSKYPHDILFNALRLGKNIYARLDHISKFISEIAQEEGYALKNVKQGYAKCSVCPVGNNAAITADASLAKAMCADGTDVLLISQKNIRLDGYDTGFIGGCSGSDAENIYFSGNILLHPDGKLIADFCEKHQKKAVSLSDEPLYDVGSLFFL